MSGAAKHIIQGIAEAAQLNVQMIVRDVVGIDIQVNSPVTDSYFSENFHSSIKTLTKTTAEY